MKVAAAIDSFKGSLSSMEAGWACQKGIERACPEAEVMVCPVADGGEGTLDALIQGMDGKKEEITVTGPMGRPVACAYGIIDKEQMAVIEMSAAAGLPLVSIAERNPMLATTFGVGELIRDAVNRGCRNFIIGIGGSATNDGGAGMLQALGWRLLDDSGREIPRGAQGLLQLDRIDADGCMPELAECVFKVACDVNNPLCGELGASAVFGPQKGASLDMVRKLDTALTKFAAVTEQISPEANPDYPGSGAAGGLGFALRTFLGGSLEPGIELILQATHLEEYVKGADVVVTGEGRLDAQSVMGKAPVGVARLAKKHGKPVIAFAGGVTEDAAECNAAGIDAFFPIVRGITTLEEAMEKANAERNMADTAEQVFRLLKVRL